MTVHRVTTLPRAILRRHCTGLSMAELAVVLGMVAITSSLAAPGLHRIVQGQELRVAAADLYSAVQLTRSMAIARNEPVILTSNDAAGIDWSRGWTVYVDRDHNPGRARHAAAGGAGELFLCQPCSPAIHRLQWRGTQLQYDQQRRSAARHAVAVPRRRGTPY
jgi:Tfp pilus assembly protein FimT